MAEQTKNYTYVETLQGLSSNILNWLKDNKLSYVTDISKLSQTSGLIIFENPLPQGVYEIKDFEPTDTMSMPIYHDYYDLNNTKNTNAQQVIYNGFLVALGLGDKIGPNSETNFYAELFIQLNGVLSFRTLKGYDSNNNKYLFSDWRDLNSYTFSQDFSELNSANINENNIGNWVFTALTQARSGLVLKDGTDLNHTVIETLGSGGEINISDGQTLEGAIPPGWFWLSSVCKYEHMPEGVTSGLLLFFADHNPPADADTRSYQMIIDYNTLHIYIRNLKTTNDMRKWTDWALVYDSSEKIAASEMMLKNDFLTYEQGNLAQEWELGGKSILKNTGFQFHPTEESFKLWCELVVNNNSKTICIPIESNSYYCLSIDNSSNYAKNLCFALSQKAIAATQRPVGGSQSGSFAYTNSFDGYKQFIFKTGENDKLLYISSNINEKQLSLIKITEEDKKAEEANLYQIVGSEVDSVSYTIPWNYDKLWRLRNYKSNYFITDDAKFKLNKKVLIDSDQIVDSETMTVTIEKSNNLFNGYCVHNNWHFTVNNSKQPSLTRSNVGQNNKNLFYLLNTDDLNENENYVITIQNCGYNTTVTEGGWTNEFSYSMVGAFNRPSEESDKENKYDFITIKNKLMYPDAQTSSIELNDTNFTTINRATTAIDLNKCYQLIINGALCKEKYSTLIFAFGYQCEIIPFIHMNTTKDIAYDADKNPQGFYRQVSDSPWIDRNTTNNFLYGSIHIKTNDAEYTLAHYNNSLQYDAQYKELNSIRLKDQIIGEYQLYSGDGSEIEGVVKLDKQDASGNQPTDSDFIGGYHNNELMLNKVLFIDGREINLALPNTQIFTNVKNIVFSQESRIYLYQSNLKTSTSKDDKATSSRQIHFPNERRSRTILGELNNNTIICSHSQEDDVAFTRTKTLTFEANKLTIANEWYTAYTPPKDSQDSSFTRGIFQSHLNGMLNLPYKTQINGQDQQIIQRIVTNTKVLPQETLSRCNIPSSIGFTFCKAYLTNGLAISIKALNPIGNEYRGQLTQYADESRLKVYFDNIGIQSGKKFYPLNSGDVLYGECEIEVSKER